MNDDDPPKTPISPELVHEPAAAPVAEPPAVAAVEAAAAVEPVAPVIPAPPPAGPPPLPSYPPPLFRQPFSQYGAGQYPPQPGYNPYGYQSYGAPLGPRFSIGDVLGKSFGVWGRNFLPFVVITAVLFIPSLIWGLGFADDLQDIVDKAIASNTSPDDVKWQVIRHGLSGSVLQLGLQILVSTALTYGVVKQLQGERAGMFATVGRGFLRFLPALGVSVLVFVCFLAGLVALIIPGIMVYCTLYVATQASVIEKPGLFGALSRSATLTKGHRMELFAIAIIVFFANAIINKLLEMVVLPEDPTQVIKHFRSYIWADYIHNVLSVSLQAVFASVSYYLLRAEKEGTSAHEIAKVFD